MASAKREHIMGAWDRAPRGAQGQSPWWGLGDEAHEAESLIAFGRFLEMAKLPHSLYFAN